MDLGARHITQLTVGTWQAEVLYTLAELDVFATLSRGGLTAEALAERDGLHPMATRALLDAGVALRLLTMDGGTYGNAELSERLLTGATDESLVEWVRTMGRWARLWSQLTEVVKVGGPAHGKDARLNQDPAYVGDLEIGFYRYAVRMADELVECIDEPLSGRILDIGGGCGAYSMALCRKHSELESQIWELPDVVPIANKVIAQHRLADRVTVVARDYTTDDYGSGLHLVLMSNLLHSGRREVAQSMLANAHRALVPEGLLVLNNNLLDDTRTRPLFSALHNLSSVVLWDGGQDFTLRELTAMITEAGFAAPDAHPISGGSAHIVVARK